MTETCQQELTKDRVKQGVEGREGSRGAGFKGKQERRIEESRRQGSRRGSRGGEERETGEENRGKQEREEGE